MLLLFYLALIVQLCQTLCCLPISYLAEPHKYQLRAYIYQARDLLASDADGFSGKIHRLKYVTDSSYCMCYDADWMVQAPQLDGTLLFVLVVNL